MSVNVEQTYDLLRESFLAESKARQEAEAEVERLRAALEKYRHCRHADLLCDCAADAIAALEHKP